MTKKDSNEAETKAVDQDEKVTIKSLIAQAKGIEPLIIGIFIIIVYWFMSAIAYFLSWKFGRL